MFGVHYHLITVGIRRPTRDSEGSSLLAQGVLQGRHHSKTRHANKSAEWRATAASSFHDCVEEKRRPCITRLLPLLPGSRPDHARIISGT
eukprot:scaffold66519_cov18-Tisochrysis_lutea.AAC.1